MENISITKWNIIKLLDTMLSVMIIIDNNIAGTVKCEILDKKKWFGIKIIRYILI